MYSYIRLLLPPAFVLLASGYLSAQCCEHTLVMQDTYGDGWNGGTLQVRVNGSLVGTYAATGQGSTGTFEVCNGDQLQLTYASGDWEEENRYQLYDPAGNVVFADGPSPAVGLAHSSIGNCDAVALPGTVACAALPIAANGCVTANNTIFAGTGIDPGCSVYSGGDIWYTLPVPPSGNIIVTTDSTGDLDDTAIALWTGPSCFELVQRGCDDDSGDGYFSRLTAYDLPVGQQVYIQLFGYNGAAGEFEVCVQDLGVVDLVSSELPIVLINTQGQQIVNGPKIQALMQMKYNGPGTITNVSDGQNEYTGFIGIDIRGATSSGYPQRPYGLETRDLFGENNNVPLLGMPSENDWALLSNFNDRSLVRNELAFHLFREMGHYAPRTHLCEVLINDDYRGIYIFSEIIKRDTGRVDIATLNPDEISGDDVTGGYILEQNLSTAENSFQSNFSPIGHPGVDVRFIFRSPAPDVITPEQRTYIAAFLDTVESALYDADFADPASGYRSWLDVPSFIAYFLVNEVARNNDGFKKSVYFNKDKNSNGGKLNAGPVWDFDWAWKDIEECDIVQGDNGAGWAHRINDCPTDNYGTGWYIRLLQDSAFANELRCTYETYRTTMLSTDHLFAFIDSVGAVVQNAQARHFQKWPILGVSGPAPENGPFADSYNGELEDLKAWITTRLAWLDANMPGSCESVSVAERTGNGPLTCYPNPSTGTFRFQGRLGHGALHRLTIRDVTSRVIESVSINGGEVVLDRTIVNSGSYFFTLEKDGHVVQQGKIVVL